MNKKHSRYPLIAKIGTALQVTENATRGIGYTRIETERAGRYFLSAKLERMQEKIIGREGRTVLTWREDSAAVICLHRKPDNRKRKENKHGLLP